LGHRLPQERAPAPPDRPCRPVHPAPSHAPASHPRPAPPVWTPPPPRLPRPACTAPWSPRNAPRAWPRSRSRCAGRRRADPCYCPSADPRAAGPRRLRRPPLAAPAPSLPASPAHAPTPPQTPVPAPLPAGCPGGRLRGALPRRGRHHQRGQRGERRRGRAGGGRRGPGAAAGDPRACLRPQAATLTGPRPPPPNPNPSCSPLLSSCARWGQAGGHGASPTPEQRPLVCGARPGTLAARLGTSPPRPACRPGPTRRLPNPARPTPPPRCCPTCLGGRTCSPAAPSSRRGGRRCRRTRTRQRRAPLGPGGGPCQAGAGSFAEGPRRLLRSLGCVGTRLEEPRILAWPPLAPQNTTNPRQVIAEVEGGLKAWVDKDRCAARGPLLFPSVARPSQPPGRLPHTPHARLTRTAPLAPAPPPPQPQTPPQQKVDRARHPRAGQAQELQVGLLGAYSVSQSLTKH
jgi:hypothetical protein